MPFRAPQRAFSVIPRRVLIYTSPDLDNGRSRRYNARTHQIIGGILHMMSLFFACSSLRTMRPQAICLEGVVFTVHTGLHVEVSVACMLL